MVTFFSNDVHPLGSSCVDHCSRRSGLVRLPEAPGFCLDSSRRVEAHSPRDGFAEERGSSAGRGAASAWRSELATGMDGSNGS